jgi:ornithine carbamoyltransferase
MFADDFLSLRDFAPTEIHHLLELAADIKARPAEFSTALRGKTLAMIFEKPSLRTRVTFDVGIQQLGGFSLYLSPAEISLGKRESIHDVAKNLERMVQGIMIRTFAHQIVEEMAKEASVPIINGLTDYSHPCQAMADFLTIKEAKGRVTPSTRPFARRATSRRATPPRGRPPRRQRPAAASRSPTIRSRACAARTSSTPTSGRAWARRRRRRRAGGCSSRTR